MDSSKEKLLIVEDDPILRDAMCRVLSANFEVVSAGDGAEGLRLARKELPDLILLDILMPGMDGIEVCRRLKHEQTTCAIPIILITASDDDDCRLRGLQAGADDLVSKPFRLKEITFRIQSKIQLAREQRLPAELLPCGNLVLDCPNFKASIAGKSIDLTRMESALLRILIRHGGHIVGREVLLNAVWNGKDVSNRVVDNHVLTLRKKLVGFDHEIVSVYGGGYGIKSREEGSPSNM